MKTALLIVSACLLCVCLSACGDSDKFVGVWEGKLGSSRLVASSRMTVLAQIKRGASGKYRVRVVSKTEKIPINPVFEKVVVLFDDTALLEDGRLRFEDGSTAEIDPKTGKLHLGDVIYTKTDYDIEIF